MSVFIIGCGYLGRRVGGHYLAAGEPVQGLVRTASSAGRLQALGFGAFALDLDRDLPQRLQWPTSDRLFYFAPPSAAGSTDARLERFLHNWPNAAGTVRRVVYVSTSGVYGDCGGDWVDESRPVAPRADRARRRWDAEQRWRQWCRRQGCELVVLRVAGIYGPGRLPLERLRKGLPLVRAQEAPFTNRIHIDDLVATCIAAMQRAVDGQVFNASDGHPSTMIDYFNQVADIAGLPRPPQISLAEGERQLSPGMLSYLRESRRLSNRKLRRELGVALRYPDLKSGLPACFAAV